MNWSNTKAVVTGGASFIGSHLVDSLLALGASVVVVDNLATGKIDNLTPDAYKRIRALHRIDLRDQRAAMQVLAGADIVFHLAALHGGRGYVDRYQARCATNFALDGIVIEAARMNEVGKLVYASSGCVYPLHLQRAGSVVKLTEDMVGPPFDCDNVYGYAKLMGEMTIRAYCREYNIRAACPRFFTVYGERGYESHAVTAMIARARMQQDPFLVWGDGEQVRNWTHVRDIVRGLILCAEKIDDGSAVNLGTEEATKVIEAVRLILDHVRMSPRIELQPHMPTGPTVRVADSSRARALLGWEPQIKFTDGVRAMADWYFATRTPEQAAEALAKFA